MDRLSRCARRLVAIDQWSALFFSLRAYGTQAPSLLTFPIFFKWWHMVDCDVFSLSANSQVLWCALHFTNDFKASASKSNECPGLSSSFNDVSPEWNFTKLVSHCPVSYGALTIHTAYFFSSLCSIVPLFEFPQHYMTNMHFQSFHFTHFRFIILMRC